MFAARRGTRTSASSARKRMFASPRTASASPVGREKTPARLRMQASVWRGVEIMQEKAEMDGARVVQARADGVDGGQGVVWTKEEGGGSTLKTKIEAPGRVPTNL